MKNRLIFLAFAAALFFANLKPLDKTLPSAIKQLENEAYALTQKAKNTEWLRNYRNVGENTQIYFEVSAVPFMYSLQNIITPARKRASEIAQKIAGQAGEYAVLQGALPFTNSEISHVITALYIKNNQDHLSESEFVDQAINLVTKLLLAKAVYILLEKARTQAKIAQAEKLIEQAQQLLDYGESL